MVAAIQVELNLPSTGSLKDKRRIVRSLLDRLRHRFNVAAAETDFLDNYRRAVLELACVSNSDKHARQMLGEIIQFIENGSEAEIIRVEWII